MGFLASPFWLKQKIKNKKSSLVCGVAVTAVLTMITSLGNFYTDKSVDHSWGSTPLATEVGMNHQLASCRTQIHTEGNWCHTEAVHRNYRKKRQHVLVFSRRFNMFLSMNFKLIVHFPIINLYDRKKLSFCGSIWMQLTISESFRCLLLNTIFNNAFAHVCVYVFVVCCF